MCPSPIAPSPTQPITHALCVAFPDALLCKVKSETCVGALVSSASGQLHPDWLDDAWGQITYQCSHIFPLLPAECGWMLCHGSVLYRLALLISKPWILFGVGCGPEVWGAGVGFVLGSSCCEEIAMPV